MKSLEFKNCSFGYNKNKFVFEDISLEIKSDDTTGYVSAIMGASGCGKTTLLKLILEVEKPFSGQIIKEPTQPVISYVPQDAMLFEHLTPLQNARYFEMINNYKPRFCNKLFDQVSTILELDCILNKSKSIYELSGGERQRLSLLRALSIQPDMLLLDEPLTGLDADVKKEFLIKLREITLQYKLLVLYVTHNNMEPQLIADEIVYMIEDEKQNVIKNISQNDIIEFIRRPPSLEAAKVFKYPDLNILYCTLDNENNIQLLKKNCNDKKGFYLTFLFDTIKISNHTGFSFDITIKTPIYTTIKLKESGAVLTLKSNLLDEHNLANKTFIQLNGNSLRYNSEGLLLDNMRLSNNKIFNSK